MNLMFEEILKKIKPIDRDWIKKAESRQMSLTKPPLSLGRLEEIANRICAIQQTMSPDVGSKKVIVCAASHGIWDEGVSPFPAEVTAQMVANFMNGGAAVNALAKTVGAKIDVIDVGVSGEIPDIKVRDQDCRFISERIAEGTRNFAKESAMTGRELQRAVGVGIEAAAAAGKNGVKLIGLGEMGIGNTTSASAITTALTGVSAKHTVGRGTGADDKMLTRKIKVVEDALKFHELENGGKPFEILQKVGGLEIACLVGICIGAGLEKIAFVTDGFIATAAVGLAVKVCPAIKDYVFASHLSVETGHPKLLEMIGQKPLFDLEMRLGEGTGTALAFGIIQASVNAFTQMATFEKAAVSNRE